jgi:hypothetical protein
MLDASPPALLDLRITPSPRGVHETPMGTGLVLSIEGTLVGSILPSVRGCRGSVTVGGRGGGSSGGGGAGARGHASASRVAAGREYHVKRVLICVTVSKEAEQEPDGGGVLSARGLSLNSLSSLNSLNRAPAAEGACGSSVGAGLGAGWQKQMRFKLACKGTPASVQTTCLLSWPSTGLYFVSIVPRLIDASGEEWDGGPASTMRVSVR